MRSDPCTDERSVIRSSETVKLAGSSQNARSATARIAHAAAAATHSLTRRRNDRTAAMTSRGAATITQPPDTAGIDLVPMTRAPMAVRRARSRTQRAGDWDGPGRSRPREQRRRRVPTAVSHWYDSGGALTWDSRAVAASARRGTTIILAPNAPVADLNELTSLDIHTDGSLILTLDDPELFNTRSRSCGSRASGTSRTAKPPRFATTC